MTESPATTLATSDPEELSPRARLLDAIFTIAASHDKVCQQRDRLAYAFYGIDDKELQRDDAPLNDLRYGLLELCAAIAGAAERRLPALEPLAEGIVDNGLVMELEGKELEAFLRPIFEEAGIGDRFEPRQSYEVFKREPR